MSNTFCNSGHRLSSHIWDPISSQATLRNLLGPYNYIMETTISSFISLPVGWNGGPRVPEGQRLKCHKTIQNQTYGNIGGILSSHYCVFGGTFVASSIYFPIYGLEKGYFVSRRRRPVLNALPPLCF